MIQKGVVFLLSDSIGETKEYEILCRENNFEHGEGGWICAETKTLSEKGIDKLSPFDVWRVSDRYLEIQMKRGVIKIIDSK
jgi:hypothetical protein